jgi:hypothetical protein
MSAGPATIEGCAVRLGPGHVLVPVILLTSGPDGWRMADLVAVIVASASGTHRLEVPHVAPGAEGPPTPGDAREEMAAPAHAAMPPDDALTTAERAALTDAVCPPATDRQAGRELWHAAWRSATTASPIRTLRLGHVVLAGATVTVSLGAGDTTTDPSPACSCPRHRSPA